jgi:cobalt/nickel transport system permease protein
MSTETRSVPPSGPAGSARSRRTTWFLLAGLAVALLLAGVVSFYASSAPDGLEKVADDHGLDAGATASHTDGSPLAGYSVAGVSNERLSVGVAGVVGVAVTFAIAGGLFLAVRRRAAGSDTSATTSD